MERAEMTARLLDVGYRMSLFPNPVGHHNEWDSVLSAAGSINGYKEKYDKIEQKKVQDYLLFDEDNPSSVYNCISNARNNALVVRTAFTSDAWIAINKTYQELMRLKTDDYTQADVPNFTEWTIQQVNMFRGAINSLLRNDGYHFIFLGAFIERADNSARLLDVKYFVLLPKAEFVGSNFAQKVREVHYDRNSKKNIYGTTTTKERNELIEEGIDLVSVPWIEEEN